MNAIRLNNKSVAAMVNGRCKAALAGFTHALHTLKMLGNDEEKDTDDHEEAVPAWKWESKAVPIREADGSANRPVSCLFYQSGRPAGIMSRINTG